MMIRELGAGFRLVVAIAVASIAVSLSARRPQDQRAPMGNELALMNELSQSFRTLESHLTRGDLDAFAAAASARADLGHKLSTLRPLVNRELVEEFERHSLRVGELVGEAAQWASQGRLVETRQTFEDLRANCVSCHLKFRSDNEKRGNYPALGNTVTGKVELRDADGVARDDRAWVLVFLESETELARATPLRKNPRVSQRERQFHPRVLPVPVGNVVEFPNDDTIFHNVFSLSKTSPFDLGVYESGRSASVRMERTGLVKVYCNIHPEMAASIVVLANPWYSLTDRGGGFVICGVPDGVYALRAWNDMGAETRQEIRLSGGVVLHAPLALDETRHSLAHTNKFGKPYSGKYR